MDLRDFESIPVFFSEEEMEELQAAIDERRSRRRLAREEECSLEPAEHSDYSLHRSDALNDAYFTVLEDTDRNNEETKAEILEVLEELKEEAGEHFDRYRREVGLPGAGVES